LYSYARENEQVKEKKVNTADKGAKLKTGAGREGHSEKCEVFSGTARCALNEIGPARNCASSAKCCKGLCVFLALLVDAN
jgi:hypothetical protein